VRELTDDRGVDCVVEIGGPRSDRDVAEGLGRGRPCQPDWLEPVAIAVYVAAIGGLTSNIRAAQEGFFSQRVFRLRLEDTHTKMQQRWSGAPHFNTWKALYRRCEQASTARGCIAHLAGHRVDPQKPNQKTLHVLLEPTWHHRRPVTWGEAKSNGYDFYKLRLFAYEWHKLLADLDQFGRILWLEEQFQKRSALM
jgi:hypothetical protein